jgi:hypothetical protein
MLLEKGPPSTRVFRQYLETIWSQKRMDPW